MVYPAQNLTVEHYFRQAQALYQARRLRDAAAVLKRVLALTPDSPQVLHFMGRIALECGQPKSAVPYLLRAIRLAPDQPSVLNDCAVALASSGETDRAVEMFQRLVRLQPDNADNYRNIGLFLISNNRCDDAIPVLKKYTTLVPGNAKGHILLNSAYSRAGKLTEGLEECERAVAADPNDLGAQLMKGLMLLLTGRPAEALPALEAAEKLDPGSASAVGHKGMAFIALGRFDEARVALKKALQSQPLIISFLDGLMNMGRVQPGDDRLPYLERALAGMQRLSPEDQIVLHLVTGKVESDLGHPAAAMAHWNAANAAQSKTVSYDEAKELGLLENLAEAFTPAYLRAHQGEGVASEKPVFIVGMPRSGTTLTEQILASHSGVRGIGEGAYWNRLLLEGGIGKDFPGHLTDLPKDFWRTCGVGYLDFLHDADSVRVIDKQPSNFRWLGAIHLALPGAKFIFVHRNPADCALSCYSKKFQTGYNFIYDLKTLGNYMQACEKLMAYWKKVLPEDCILDVQYEDIVQNFDFQTRRILSFIGLEWEDACTRFYEKERSVVTSSMYAVRQPLSAKSIGRSGPYRALMRDFFENYNKAEEQL